MFESYNIKYLPYLFFIVFITLIPLRSEEIIVSNNSNLFIDSLIIAGSDKYFSDKRISLDLVAVIQIKIRSNKTLLQKKNITLIIDNILDYYSINGFPFCQASVKSIDRIDPDKVLLEIEVNSNEYVTISSINFTGNKNCSYNTLLRESRLSTPAFKFNPEKLNNAKKYLWKTLAFSSIPEYFIIQDQKSNSTNKSFGVLFSVEEEKYNSIDAIFGYSNEKSNNNDTENKSNFLGKIDLSLNNLFGTFRKTKLSWYRGISNEESIELYYEEPWLMNIPLKTGIGFNQDFYDSLYLERSYKLSFDYNLNLNFNLISDFKLTNIYLDSLLILNSPDNNSDDIRKESYYGGFLYTSSFFNKNQLNNNNNGFSLEIIAGTIKKTLFNSELEHNKEKISYDANIKFDFISIYRIFANEKNKNSIGNRFFIKNRLNFEHIFTENDSLPIYDKLKLGGINTIRGYKEDQFNTTSNLIINNDLVFKIDDSTKLFLLYDIAIWGDNILIEDLFKEYNYISGAGIGISYFHRLGEMEVSYALPIEEGFESGKIHVRYINKF